MQKNMVWFDTKLGAKGSLVVQPSSTATHNDGISQAPLRAAGLMAKFTRSVCPATAAFSIPA